MTTYIHLVGGYAYGRRHEPGDIVWKEISKKKLAEWLAAGIITEDFREEEDESER